MVLGHLSLQQLSLKAQIIIWHYFHKAQIIIWHYFINPNNNLATIPTKTQIYFGNYFTKTKALFWQKQLLYTQNPNANLTLFYKVQMLI